MDLSIERQAGQTKVLGWAMGINGQKANAIREPIEADSNPAEPATMPRE